LFNLVPNANDDLLNENRLKTISEAFKHKSNYIEPVIATASVMWGNHGDGVENETVFRKAIDKTVNNSLNDHTNFDELHALSLVNKTEKRAVGRKNKKDKDNADGTVEKRKKTVSKDAKKTKKDGDVDKPKQTRKRNKAANPPAPPVNEHQNKNSDVFAPNDQQVKNIADVATASQQQNSKDHADIDKTTKSKPTAKKSKNKKRKTSDDDDEEDEIENEKSSSESEEEKSSSEEEDNKSEGDSVYDSDETNYKKENNEGWIEKRRNFNVRNYGNAAMYVHKHFMTKDKKNFTYQTNKEKDAKLFVGKVVSIVVKKQNKDILHFKFTNNDAPTTFGYYPCLDFMSSKSPVTFINRVEDATMTKNSTKLPTFVVDGDNLLGRSIKKLFALNDKSKKYFTGKIISYDKKTKAYSVLYSDGTTELENQNTINDCLKY
jgi:hypothetical protein